MFCVLFLDGNLLVSGMRMSVILHICINIFFGKHLGIQNLIFSCSLSIQILHNIPDGFITDLITGPRTGW